MARFNIRVNSEFTPFSFDRYMQPLQIYANMYERQEAALDALDEQASQWERLADMAGNEKSYAKYKAYADDLRQKAYNFHEHGLTPESRQELMDLRRRYRKEVKPIEENYKRWQELEKEQRLFSAQNNFNVRYDNDYSQMRLDDFIANPNQSYTAIKGDDVINKTAALSKQALQAIVDNPEITEAERGLLITKMQSGATLQQLNRALQMGLQPGETGDAAVDALLQVARTVDASYQSNGAYDANWMWNNIAQGLYGGVGTTTYNIMQDPWDISPLQKRQMELQEAQFEWEKEKDTAEFNAKYGNRNGQGVNPDTGNPIFYDDKGIAHEGIPEVVNGIRTGRIYNLVIKKYVNQDGTMSAQGNYAESIGDPVRFKPIFARSWSAGASNAYTRQRTWTGSDDEASKVSYSDIHGRELKRDVKNFLLRALDVPDLSEEQVKELSGYLDIYRDQDMLSNNHWVIKIPGTDNDGNVLTDSESKSKFNTAMANMNNRVIAAPTVTNLAPAGVEEKKK